MNTAGQEIISKSTTIEADMLRDKLATQNRRWESICNQVIDRRDRWTLITISSTLFPLNFCTLQRTRKRESWKDLFGVLILKKSHSAPRTSDSSHVFVLYCFLMLCCCFATLFFIPMIPLQVTFYNKSFSSYLILVSPATKPFTINENNFLIWKASVSEKRHKITRKFRIVKWEAINVERFLPW